MFVIWPASRSGFSWVLLVILRVRLNYLIKHVSLKFYSHQLMLFLIQICIGILSYIKIT